MAEFFPDRKQLDYRRRLSKIAAGFAERFRIIVWIGFCTGMRPSEALGLTWGQLDFQSGTITIDRQVSRSPNKVFSAHLKTSASYRVIAFAPQLQKLIKEHVGKVQNLLHHHRNDKIETLGIIHGDGSQLITLFRRPFATTRNELRLY